MNTSNLHRGTYLWLVGSLETGIEAVTWIKQMPDEYGGIARSEVEDDRRSTKRTSVPDYQLYLTIDAADAALRELWTEAAQKLIAERNAIDEKLHDLRAMAIQNGFNPELIP